MSRHQKFELFGWYGAIALTLAYVLVTIGTIPAQGFWFQFLNASGALGIFVISMRKKVYQPAVINAIRVGVGLVALVAIGINSFR